MANATYLRARERADRADAERAAKRARVSKIAANPPSFTPAAKAGIVNALAVPACPVDAQAAQEETTPRPKQMCLCHGDRPIEAHGFCQKSYDSLRFSRPPKLPNDVIGEQRERAELIAWRVKPAKTKVELMADKFSKPEVAEFVAANVVKKSMDYEEGIKAAMPELTSPVEIGIVANQAKQSPSVQAAIDETLKQKGLDQDSKDYFVQKLWAWFESKRPEEERLTLQAARILGKHFIEQQVSAESPQSLVLEDVAEGLKEMGLSDADLTDNVGLSAVALPSMIDLDEEDEEAE